MYFTGVATLVGIGLTLLSFILYYRDIIAGRTKPHAFSWFVWGVLETTAFALQYSEGGGVGAWILGCSMLFTSSIAVVGLVQRSLKYTITDWLALLGACLGITLWVVTKQPLMAAILITISDLLGFIPTLRKAWLQPHADSVSMYLLSMFKQALSALAVRPRLTTVMYPTVLVFTNLLCTLILLWRRRSTPKATLK